MDGVAANVPRVNRSWWTTSGTTTTATGTRSRTTRPNRTTAGTDGTGLLRRAIVMADPLIGASPVFCRAVAAYACLCDERKQRSVTEGAVDAPLRHDQIEADAGGRSRR